jgi:hypothetical protein
VNDVFLGIIAVATLAIAIGQIGVMVTAGLLAKRLARLAEQLERDVKPFIGHLNAMGRDASRATALAAAQVERADQLFGDLAVRLDDALNAVQASLGVPAREGRAILSAFRAFLQVIRDMRRGARPRTRGEEDDALFI